MFLSLFHNSQQYNAAVVILIFVLIFPSVSYVHGTYNSINIIVDSEKDPKGKLYYDFTQSDLSLENATLNTIEKKLRLTLNNSVQDNKIPQYLEVQINRSILDSKNFSRDIPFIVHVGSLNIPQDKNPANGTFFTEIAETEKYRTLFIDLSSLNLFEGLRTVSIEGNHVLEPNFIEILSVIMKPYSTSLSLIIALILTPILFIIFLKYIRMKGKDGKKDKERMFDVMLDEKWYPSLPRFQIFVWTVTIVFAFLWVTSYKLISLDIGYGNIPYNLLLLMGISAATYTLSRKASDLKYSDYPSSATEEKFPRPEKPYSFKGILYDGDKKSLSRVQYFVWTIISIITYLIILIFTMTFANNMLKGLPDLPLALVILMGIGQGIFVGGKYSSIKGKFEEDKPVPPSPPNPDPIVTNYTSKYKVNDKYEGDLTNTYGKDTHFVLSVEVKDNNGNPKKDVEVKFISLPSTALAFDPPTQSTNSTGIAKTNVRVISNIEATLSYEIDGKVGNSLTINQNESDED